MKLKEELKKRIFHQLYLFAGTDRALIKKRIARVSSALGISAPKPTTITSDEKWEEFVTSLQERSLFSKIRLDVAELSFNPKTLDFKIGKNNYLIVTANKPIKFKIKDCYIEETDKLFGKPEYIKYIRYIISTHKKSASSGVIEKIYEICGKDLAKIESETLKLITYIGKQQSIKIEDLTILIQKESTGWINLYRSDALSYNDRFLKAFETSGKPAQAALGAIFNSLIKKPNYPNKEKFKRALELIKQADIATKTTGTDLEFVILRQLLIKLYRIINNEAAGESIREI